MGDGSPFDPEYDDEFDSLAALDFSRTDDEAESSLDVFDVFEVGQPAGGDPDAGPNGEPWNPAASVDDADETPAPVFTVTNPPGTVTVATYLDGRVHQIALSSKVVNMTERELGDEIRVIAELAAQQARSAQYSFMLEGMREHGHDDAATRDFLTRDLNLPTPEQADANQAQVFSTRYGGDHG
ncbi:YbaB/EbfC family DNA-binding protein [Mycolicibacterium goodii]|uniref:YbaB/EbfC family DNA-binding protein n=1 Tax=Mycolicibacterium goodii TaxID=134601 RepID=UPI001BDD0DF8|nr:YbaB/EbfC family DNA-binding protein [Mycolicibacterium goodii]MBU8810795.1 YbaB/EbfC family DNA-binding protein [Mycolicibacterium goodii]